MVISAMSHVCKARDCAWGKSVVITGASSGIGRALAYEFCRRHASVALLARSGQSLEDIARECENSGGRVLTFRVDVADEPAVKEITQKVIQSFGRIDIWINNAAVSLFGRLEEVPSSVLHRVIETNLFGYINGIRAVLPYFRQEGAGTIVNISSLASKIAQPYTAAYNASKAAVNGIGESARAELADIPDIRVSTVIVGSVDTPLFQHAANYSGRAIRPLPPVSPVNKAARRIVAVALKPRRQAVVGHFLHAALYAHTVFPGLTERIAAKIVNRRHFRDRTAEPTMGNVFEPKENLNSESGGWYQPPRRRRPASRQAIGLASAAIGAVAAGMLLMKNAGRHRKTVTFREPAFYSMNVAE